MSSNKLIVVLVELFQARAQFIEDEVEFRIRDQLLSFVLKIAVWVLQHSNVLLERVVLRYTLPTHHALGHSDETVGVEGREFLLTFTQRALLPTIVPQNVALVLLEHLLDHVLQLDGAEHVIRLVI